MKETAKIKRVDVVGLHIFHLKWFRLFQKVLMEMGPYLKQASLNKGSDVGARTLTTWAMEPNVLLEIAAILEDVAAMPK